MKQYLDTAIIIFAVIGFLAILIPTGFGAYYYFKNVLSTNSLATNQTPSTPPDKAVLPNFSHGYLADFDKSLCDGRDPSIEEFFDSAGAVFSKEPWNKNPRVQNALLSLRSAIDELSAALCAAPERDNS